jgi:4-amino-4-deoxy-L-arabinose transferase-like glycosyltransferase
VPDAAPLRLSPRAAFALWIVTLPLFLAGLGTPVVQRTQEARVLETAREMYDSPDPDRWLIPRCNDDVRLNKPPLEYWLPAVMFKALGVTEFAGRLPFALAGWLTLAVVYRFGRALIDPTFGLLSAAILLSSYMFFRHSRLAETDGLAAFFLTAGVYWLWRGGVEQRRGRSFAFFHLAAASLGLVVMSKGAPAAFAVLFFVAWIIVERNRAAGARFLLSGAWVTALVVGGAWYFAIRHSPHFRVLWEEVKVVTGGEYHRRSFVMYVPDLLVATAPWTAFVVVGAAWAIRRWRRDPAARVVLIWTAAVLLPLCLIRQKQNHYLVSLIAPLAMLAAYAVRRALAAIAEAATSPPPAGDTAAAVPREARVVRALFRATLAVSLLAPAGVYLAARQGRGLLMTVDFLLCVLLLAGVIAAIAVGRRHGLAASVMTYAAAVAVGFTALHGRWAPTLRPVNHRTIAASIVDTLGDDRPCVFYGSTSNASLSLVWNLRRVIPVRATEADLRATLAAAPRTIVIAQTKNNVSPPPVPPELHERAGFDVAGDDSWTIHVYTLDP